MLFEYPFLIYIVTCAYYHIHYYNNGLVQEKRNSIANSME